MGNSFTRVLLGGSEKQATTGWTDGKPWEIALGRSVEKATTGWTDGKPWEIAWGDCWEGARRKRGERDGSVDTVDRWETEGNSLGRVPLGGSETEAWTLWTDGKPWE